ncbi:hypothetical protein D6821_01730 [Candidatus Parcubacteria bacterium]|nr:MAG: hypothetical protein D6821_01730 [Candidatus Parcubacteria bacterium]
MFKLKNLFMPAVGGDDEDKGVREKLEQQKMATRKALQEREEARRQQLAQMEQQGTLVAKGEGDEIKEVVNEEDL